MLRSRFILKFKLYLSLQALHICVEHSILKEILYMCFKPSDNKVTEVYLCVEAKAGFDDSRLEHH